jgi:hypothetical protein
MLYQIQQIMHDRVMHVPIYELAFFWGIGSRVGEACVDHIKGFSYSAPYEDLSPGRPVHRVVPPPLGLGCPGGGMDRGTTDGPKSRRSSLRTA